MVYVCVCKYPLIIIDNRDGDNVEYTAMPTDLIEGGDIPAPTIVPIKTEGLDGILRDYIAVQWQQLAHQNIKGYDVIGHVVYAGCEPSEIKIVNGEVKCDSKKIYIVLHPAEEWIDHHMIQLPSQ
jgi:hypothetical protein